MNRTIILFLLFSLLAISCFGQRWSRERHQITFGFGGTGFMGELGGANDIGSYGPRDFDINAVRYAFMAGYRYRIYEILAATGNLSFGYVYGNDEFTEEPFRNNRNIHFRSPVVELSSSVQFFFFNYERPGAYQRRITSVPYFRFFGAHAYLFAGLGAFYFNPQGYFDASEYNGTIHVDDLPPNGWYDLRPLSTEGQGFFATREKYSPFSMVIPFGIGGQVKIARNLSVGLQYGFRKTFTDYMDDVSTTYVDPAIFPLMFDDTSTIALAEHFSNPTNNNLSKVVTAPGQQRGNPFNYDSYMFAFITLYYTIPTRSGPFGLRRF